MKLYETNNVNLYNLIYMNFFTLVLFIIYLLMNYVENQRYYKELKKLLEDEDEDMVFSLPTPNNYEQKLYIELIKNLYEMQRLKLNALYDDKKENEEFITSWVHEIKNPIAVSRLIMQNSEGKYITDILDSLEDELDKIDGYVEQSLYYSRSDSFSSDYLINDLEINKLVRVAVKKQAKTFINKQIRVEITGERSTVSSDGKWLSFIIDQILTNSLKYTGNGGIIKINMVNDDGQKKLSIEDNGTGIKEEDISRVFNKGFTGINGRDRYKSTGMGLYLAKTLAKKLGHDISIESIYGKYTKVIISFPKLNAYYRFN
ncbi:sensor histidine kinase [Clostridium uliginosum]|uniref:sensor histidine kinase n=1 Tax=Clostridium uliginosum TaxID=119641 RepID=UPI0015880A2E|nr:sensor histidine kinase [Clostridium uliginosum]